jgi:hypothetical protein
VNQAEKTTASNAPNSRAVSYRPRTANLIVFGAWPQLDNRVVYAVDSLGIRLPLILDALSRRLITRRPNNVTKVPNPPQNRKP